MCYHASTPNHAELQKFFTEMHVSKEIVPYYHVSGFVRPYLPVTLNNEIDSIVLARWKLIPFWVKSEEEANKYANTLNATSEDIFEKASYKNAITKTRGLLYVKGFFEPHATDGKKNNESYFVQVQDQPIFTLGIVWNKWQDYNTFSIITTEANDFMADIHNVGKRMPLIIPEDKRHNWLLADGRDEIESLMQPYSGEMKAHRTFRVMAAGGVDTNVPTITDEI
ncbi:SOS response-associated peptidase [Sphingobacterium yanglingense]|uniref:Abasic site processing protein n=1 Tax=Sphingobacterium yanglingense TaxID=1437280 RepID=A0A4R6WNB8_9SPHI|nr:SOS response-associated peptidase family protein [Sphingobacterium yanglingense]TDQ79601.1 SOS response associated peptidase (SRAP) [Sphingobacterium yanglingense]